MQPTSSAKKMHTENLRQRAHKEEKIKIAAQEIAEKLAGIKLIVGAKTSTSGKIFGSVNTIQIAESLKEKGFDIDRRSITLPEDQIKEVGNYKAVVKLHREVKVEIEFRNRRRIINHNNCIHGRDVACNVSTYL